MDYYRYFCEEDRALCYALELDKFGGFPPLPEPPDTDPKYGVSQTLRGLRLSEDNKKILMYTRAGGVNRQCKQQTEDCCCKGCVISRIFPSHPLYIKDYDSDSSLNAIIEFKTPYWVEEMIKHYGQKEAINILKEQAENES